MALPSSGQISYSQLNTEANLAYNTSNTSVNGRITTYNKLAVSSNQSPTYFYGITWDSVTSSYGDLTTSSSSTSLSAYRTISHSGHDNGKTMRIQLTASCSSGSAGLWYLQYAINGTSWITIHSDDGTLSATDYMIPYSFDYNDIVRVRIYTTHTSGNPFSGNFTIKKGFYVTGGGAWARTGTYSWNWSG